MSKDWMKGQFDEFIDIHDELRPFHQVQGFLEIVERESTLLEYCNGRNASGRWIFQIYSQEFIDCIVQTIRPIVSEGEHVGPILEVMAGDGLLSEFIKSKLSHDIIITDSKKDRHDIAYPKDVIEMEAIDAIRQFTPAVVILSWEPYYSTVSEDIVDLGVPLLWIGDTKSCGVHSDIRSRNHTKIECAYMLGRHDTLCPLEQRTGMFLFNQ